MTCAEYWSENRKRRILDQIKHLRWRFFVKIVKGFYPLTIFGKGSIIDI